MAGMVPRARQPLDDGGHARPGPQIGAEAVGSRPLAEGSIHSLEVLAVKLRLAPRSAGRVQGHDHRYCLIYVYTNMYNIDS